MSRSPLEVALACLLALVCTYSTNVNAQDGEEGRRRRGGDRGGRDGGGDRGGAGQQRSNRGGFSRGSFSRTLDRLTLVGIEQVQKELKIKEDQAGKIEEISTASRQSRRELFEKLRDGADLDRDQQRAAYEKARAKQRQETEKKLVDVLDKKQAKRLGEIHLQQQGIQALTSPEIIATLKLSDEQVQKIKDIIAGGDEERRALFGGFGRGGRERGGREGRERGGREGRERRRPSGEDGFAPDEQDDGQDGDGEKREGRERSGREGRERGGREGRERGGREGRERGGFGGFEDIREKMAAIQKKTEDSCLAVLSKKQREQFVSMQGEKFELDRRSMFRRGSRDGESRRGSDRGSRGRRRRPGDDEEEI